MINPFGGAGAAPRNWLLARPILEAASHIELTIRETDRAHHAFEIVNAELAPGQYNSIVTVSGDGLIHEVVNGIMTREDRAAFLATVTIGVIPGGTGNALIKSLLAHTNEECGILEAAYLVARGNRGHMDMTELTLEYEQRRVYSFLSVAWAIVADCDINSEVIRWAGSARFTMWGVWRCMSMIRYRGSLEYTG